MKTEIIDKPIALIVQIDPGSREVMEIVLKTEFSIEGHTGVRDLWWKDVNTDDKRVAKSLVDKSIKEMLDVIP